MRKSERDGKRLCEHRHDGNAVIGGVGSLPRRGPSERDTKRKLFGYGVKPSLSRRVDGGRTCGMTPEEGNETLL